MPETNWDREAWGRLLREHSGPLSAEQVGLVEEVFTYHKPTDEQRKAFDAVRFVCATAARTVLEVCPPCADRTLALQHLRDARMHANSSIALGGRA